MSTVTLMVHFLFLFLKKKFFLQSGFCSVTQAGLELLWVLLSLPPKCWGYRHIILPHSTLKYVFAYGVFFFLVVPGFMSWSRAETGPGPRSALSAWPF